MIFTPAYVIVGQYFSKNKGKAMGISTIGSGLGTVVIAPLISFLLDMYGYPGAMMIVGALMLNNCIAAALYRPVEGNFPKKRQKKDQIPEKLNEPLIDAQSDTDRKDKVERIRETFLVLTRLTFLLYCVEITAMSMAIQTFLTFLPGLAKELKVADRSKSALLLSIMGIADMTGRLLVGFVMDLKQVREMPLMFGGR